MAFNFSAFESMNAETNKDFFDNNNQAVPSGEYTVRINEIELEESEKAPNGSRVKVEVEIMDGKYTRRKIWYYFNIWGMYGGKPVALYTFLKFLSMTDYVFQEYIPEEATKVEYWAGKGAGSRIEELFDSIHQAVVDEFNSNVHYSLVHELNDKGYGQIKKLHCLD